MYLVKFAGNWADEFDCQGFMVIKDRIWYDAFVAYYEDYDNEIDKIYFGTNECFEWAHGKDMLKDFSIEEIRDEYANALKALVGKYRKSYGIIPYDLIEDRIPDGYYKKLELL